MLVSTGFDVIVKIKNVNGVFRGGGGGCDCIKLHPPDNFKFIVTPTLYNTVYKHTTHTHTTVLNTHTLLY